jgi:hypothetical protein
VYLLGQGLVNAVAHPVSRSEADQKDRDILIKPLSSARSEGPLQLLVSLRGFLSEQASLAKDEWFECLA